MKSLENKVAFITGGAVNLGKAIALRLAQGGADIVLFAPEEAELEQTAGVIRAAGRRVLTVVGDVRSEQEIQAAIEQTRAELAPIDILVNNAGIMGPTAPVADVTLDEWNECLAVNLTGAFLCSKLISPQMIDRRSGKIVNISSIAGRIGYALRTPYAASKWGLIGLSKTLANELGPFNIQVNAVLPGPVQGDRIRRVIAARAEELGQSVEQITADYVCKSALGRMVCEEDVAAMVAFLSSAEADNVTGEAIDVSAGYGI